MCQHQHGTHQQPQRLALRQRCLSRHITSASSSTNSSSSSCRSSNCLTPAASSRRHALLAAALVLQQLPGLAAAAAPAHAAQLQPWRGCFALADIQADYDRCAPSYDELDGGAASAALGFPELRQQLLQQASGDVLEVAVGTGLNLPLYDWQRLTSLTGLDLSEGMLIEAAARVQAAPQLAKASLVAASGSSGNSSSDGSSSSDSSNSGSGSVPVRLVQGDVVQLPFPDASFDVVLDTFSLCVFGQPQAALAEMARVLRPGGCLLLLEHSRSDNALLGAYQGATRSLVAPLSKGCDWGQDVPSMLLQLPAMRISSQQRHLAGTLVGLVATKLE
uniref:Methyltransferase type 11 domain-containing protein n=1 Tax=Tetradesmus obliquus TaxID=3088 RepID=A0A383VFN4_TETOB|eukprot:jgi/Sobl393_1/5449/SZX64375.1